MRRRRGFSQIEVAVAIVVLAVGILGVFGAFSFSLESTKAGGRLSEALGYDRQILELIRSRGLPFIGTLPPPPASGLNDTLTREWSRLRPLEDFPFAADLPANTGFRRSVQVRRVTDDPSDYRYEIAEITVTVFWMEADRLKEVSLTGDVRRP